MSGGLIVQSRPNGTSNTTVYTASLRVELTRVMVANTANAARTFSLFHDETGVGTYSQANALFYGKTVSANDTYVLDANVPGGGLALNKNAKLGFAPSAANDLTLTIYGIVQAPR